MKNSENRKWLAEYEAFLVTEEIQVPKSVTEKVFSHMQNLINPRAWNVFFKILCIHVGIGLLSLSICHQFGMNPFGTERSLDDLFMSMWGHSVCMMACGMLFLSTSIVTAGYFLSIEEVKALRRTEFIQTFGLGVVSLVVFAVFGAEQAITVTGLWLLGALIGGFLATEAVWFLKNRAA